MRQVSFAFCLGVGFLLFGAALAANVGGTHMPEMRGAWITKAWR